MHASSLSLMASPSRMAARSRLATALCGAVALLPLAGGCQDTKAVGSRTTVLSTRPSIYLRVTPDGDASELIGAFIPDDVPDANLDESAAVRTRCSQFIKAKRIPASGEFSEIAAASSGAAGKVGVKSLARVELGGQSSEALLGRYTLLEKMQADVDEDNLARCCADAPNQCTKRFVSGALLADGNYYAATDSGSSGGLDSQALKNLPVDANIVYASDMKWERQVAFQRQYFAFSARRSLAGGLDVATGQASDADAGKHGGAAKPADACAWANDIPTDLDGSYFVGVSNPMPTEKLAREDAMRDARDQVIKYLGEFLQEAQVSMQKTVGSAADIQVLLDDTKVKESMSAGLARSVKDRKWCGPLETASPSGMKATMKALAFFPNAERKAAGVVALKMLIDKQKAAGANTAALETMLKDVEVAK